MRPNPRQEPPRVAAIYCRVSTGAQGAEGTSLASQEALCRAHAAAIGYAVEEAHIYREIHTGAELWERPRLTALRQVIRGGEVGALLAYSLDRLSREQGHVYILDDECQRAGVALLFVTEEFEATPIGKMIRSVKAFAAELEREKIRERTTRGKQAIAASGRLHNGGPELFGYRRDKEARVRLVHEGEAAIVRQIFRWIGEGRMPLREVARRLNEDGIPPPSAGKTAYPGAGRVPRWGKSQLHRILGNPAYKGEPYGWRYRRSQTHAMLTRPEEEWLALDPETTPALVSPDLWEAAQRQLATNTGAPTRNAERPYLLRGHIFCAVCGARMYCDTERDGRRVYRCSSRDKAGGACGARRVPAEAIEARVWARLRAAIEDPDLIRQQWEAASAAGPDAQLAADRDAATRALDKLTRQQERLVRRLRDADDEDLGALIERELRQLGQERRALRTTIAGIDARLGVERAGLAQLGALADFCARVAANLAAFDFDRQRLALAAFGVRVEASGTEDMGPWRLTGSIPLPDPEAGREGDRAGVTSRTSSRAEQNARSRPFALVLTGDGGR